MPPEKLNVALKGQTWASARELRLAFQKWLWIEAKIKCARKHFKAIAADNVQYDFINYYSALHDILVNVNSAVG